MGLREGSTSNLFLGFFLRYLARLIFLTPLWPKVENETRKSGFIFGQFSKYLTPLGFLWATLHLLFGNEVETPIRKRDNKNDPFFNRSRFFAFFSARKSNGNRLLLRYNFGIEHLGFKENKKRADRACSHRHRAENETK